MDAISTLLASHIGGSASPGQEVQCFAALNPMEFIYLQVVSCESILTAFQLFLLVCRILVGQYAKQHSGRERVSDPTGVGTPGNMNSCDLPCMQGLLYLHAGLVTQHFNKILANIVVRSWYDPSNIVLKS